MTAYCPTDGTIKRSLLGGGLIERTDALQSYPEMAGKNNGGVIQAPGCLQLPVLKCTAGPLYPADRANEQLASLLERERER